MEYNEELIQETLTAQAEVIKGKAIGYTDLVFFSFHSISLVFSRM